MNRPDAPAAPIGDEQIVAAARALGAAGGSVATRILSALQQADAEPRQVAALIELEPMLVVRVLRVANSAYYGRSGSIGSLDRALAVLGLNAVKGIAAAACLDRMLPARSDRAASTVRQLARHGLASAAAAQALARRSSNPELADAAFMAAILHDLGIAIQHRLNPQGVAALADAAARAAPGAGAAPALREAELRHVGATHERCARVAFASWNLPASLATVAAGHHAPLDVGLADRPLAALVHLAHRLASAAGYGLATEPVGGDLPAAIPLAAGLGAAPLEDVAHELPESAAALVGALSAP